MRLTHILSPLLGLIALACSNASSERSNSLAGDYSYCGALTATCSPSYTPTPTACSRAAAKQCESLQTTRSDSYRSAVVACAKQHSPCVIDFVNCIEAQAWQVTPTAAQQKVKDDFCAVCPDTGSGVGPCSTFFSKDTEAGPGIYGVGVPVLEVNDAIAAEIDSVCVGTSLTADGGLSDAGACDPLAFALCANTVLREKTTPAECQPDAG